ncbi:MAG TPA: hypothetical protein VNM43_03960 [Dehalococcoidia bacterium]|nr:hypothetical protein [Dehalococcoidia bacterium]
MRRLAIAAVTVVAIAMAPAPVLAHRAGHAGGCEAFGHLNRAIGADPAAFGFPGARNLGDIVSAFAQMDDGQPGVGDIVEQIDHGACG